MDSDASRRRLVARIDQVVCTLEGMVTLLGDTPGDFAVVVHGDRDCLSVLVQGMAHPGTERFFGTQLVEIEAVAGRGGARLEECLEAVCGEMHPQVVFLLGTCLSALLGEEAEALVRKASRESGVPVISLGRAGMGFVTQGEILDRHACLLLEAASCLGPPTRTSEDAHGLCLVGFDPGPEVRGQMAQLGLEVRAVLDRGAPLSSWRALPGARAHAVLDLEIYPQLTTELRTCYGQEGFEVPFPVGIRATRSFFEAILGASGLGPEAEAFLTSSSTQASKAVAAARRRCEGARLGYNLGSKKNLDPRTLARAGLADLPAFEELGLSPLLLVQGDDSPERVEALRATLVSLGCAVPFKIFPDTVFFGDLCRAQGCDLVYASDHLREQVETSGAGFLAMGVLEPGWGGVPANVGRILGALGRTP